MNKHRYLCVVRRREREVNYVVVGFQDEDYGVWNVWNAGSHVAKFGSLEAVFSFFLPEFLDSIEVEA